MSRGAIFLDRDGTINEDSGYPSDYSQIKIYPQSFEAVRRLNSTGLPVIILTNQSAVGRGLLTEEKLRLIHERMREAFARENARLAAFYYCPHYELSSLPRYRADCNCRKPNPGLALRAAADFGIDPAQSYMVGDKTGDVLLALNIKAAPVLVLSGQGRKSLAELKALGVEPSCVAADVLRAADWILERERPGATKGR
ncbi:MAG: HAD family hydrolase [Candidatus Aminicenantes bacterium]|nr:HAD family hydrolase [Candidatus Aminicenantes bacterium]